MFSPFNFDLLCIFLHVLLIFYGLCPRRLFFQNYKKYRKKSVGFFRIIKNTKKTKLSLQDKELPFFSFIKY